MNLKMMKKAFLDFFPDIWRVLVTYWPGVLGYFLRYRYYKRRLKYLGQGATIDFGVYMMNPSQISIGEKTHIDRHVTLVAGDPRESERLINHKDNSEYEYERGEIHIGCETHIAPYAYLVGIGGLSIGDRCGIGIGTRAYSISHHYRNISDPTDRKVYSFSNTTSDDNQFLIVSPVVIKNNSSLCASSVILPGGTIGDNSCVGMFSCVRGTIPSDVVASGDPAKVIKPII